MGGQERQGVSSAVSLRRRTSASATGIASYFSREPNAVLYVL